MPNFDTILEALLGLLGLPRQFFKILPETDNQQQVRLSGLTQAVVTTLQNLALTCFCCWCCMESHPAALSLIALTLINTEYSECWRCISGCTPASTYSLDAFMCPPSHHQAAWAYV